LQVPPAELENLLRTHKDVADVAVIGVPHERQVAEIGNLLNINRVHVPNVRFGEAPRAYIVPKVPQSDALAEEIKAFVKDNVVEYKQLVGGVEFVNAIPKSAAGKILRRELVDAYKKSEAFEGCNTSHKFFGGFALLYFFVVLLF
jgi:4-coumarate--CoA ligase